MDNLMAGRFLEALLIYGRGLEYPNKGLGKPAAFGIIMAVIRHG